jgi:hypothetical protein
MGPFEASTFDSGRQYQYRADYTALEKFCQKHSRVPRPTKIKLASRCPFLLCTCNPWFFRDVTSVSFLRKLLCLDSFGSLAGTNRGTAKNERSASCCNTNRFRLGSCSVAPRKLLHFDSPAAIGVGCISIVRPPSGLGPSAAGPPTDCDRPPTTAAPRPLSFGTGTGGPSSQ